MDYYNDEEDNDKLPDDFESEYDKSLITKIDDLEKQKIDKKRIKNTDQTKKIAAIESVFDERTIFHLNKILRNGPLEEIVGIISAGKEANVYLGYDKKGKEVALKIYKIDSNTSRWMRNYIIGDPRFKKIPHSTSKIIYLWASKEFKNLKRASNANLNVPEPYYIRNNILMMDFIGFGNIPAPKLKDLKKIDNPLDTFDSILYFIKNLYQKANLVHGDLSEFNILYHNQEPIIIDISQAVSIHHPKSHFFLVRDIKNIFYYFEKIGVATPDPEEFYYEVIED